MRNEKGNSDLVVVITIIMFFVVVSLAWKWQEVATSVALNVSTLSIVTLLFGILAAVCIWFINIGIFKQCVWYLPLGIFFCLLPALNFWCWEYIIPTHKGILSLFTADNLIGTRNEPLWYGRAWVQVLGFIILLALGYFQNERRD